MRFPDYKRVIYDKNPLDQVICQLRFPAILRIESEKPAPFQERIREYFPLMKERDEAEHKIQLPNEIARILGPDLPLTIAPGRQIYSFDSEDEKWKVALTRDFVALTALKYRKWDQFKEKLNIPLTAFKEIYRPAFYQRIGLRYRDVIRRSELNLKDSEWAELLKPHIAGELASSDVSSAVQSAVREVVIALEAEKGQVRIKHGLTRDKKSGETCFLIDADFFTDERTGVDDAEEKLDYFNKEAGRLFRWCITDKLHAAMGPTEV